MLNLVVNIVFGFGLETIYFGYIYNNIKNVKYKSTYIYYLISSILSFLIQNFTYNNLYLTYIFIALIFYILYAITHKEWKQITNFFLMLNIILISSILTTIPILIFGYNSISFILNRLEMLLILLIVKKINLNKLYKLIIRNWNRTTNNKIKSVSVRNFTMIFIYIFLTFINIFVNDFFMNIYKSVF